MTTVPNDLESRRRAVARAFRAVARNPDRTTGKHAGRSADVAPLEQRVAALAERVDELTRVVNALRPADVSAIPIVHVIEEEAPANRVSVPPVTAGRISNQAFDVLLGTVSADVPGVGAEPRIA
jgi:hypothetical protein